MMVCGLSFVSCLQDYPSISFLNFKMQEADILPIFAVTQEAEPAYQVKRSSTMDAGNIQSFSEFSDLAKRSSPSPLCSLLAQQSMASPRQLFNEVLILLDFMMTSVCG